jgi:hypothetical protein
VTATNPKATTTLNAPTPDPQNVETKKYYVFNETGNIMLASTDSSSEQIQQSVREVFAEVAVFFAAMTKAITMTPNPAQPGSNYTIYNYDALSNVIGGSGLFVQVTEEDVSYSTTSTGVQFSQEMIQALLGLATGTGELAFASAMVASMGQEGLKISSQSSSTNSEIANIIFVCEYLLGMPVVSAIVVRADVTENSQNIAAGPCFNASAVQKAWFLHKDTYLFVTPTFIRKYAGDLESVETDPDYASLVNFLVAALLQTPLITGVILNGQQAPAGLETTNTYTIQGEYLGYAQGTLQFVGQTGATATVLTWGPEMIEFTVSGTLTTAAAIGVYPPGATSPAAQTTETYTVSAGS